MECKWSLSLFRVFPCTFDVNSSCSHICGNDQLHGARFQLAERLGSRLSWRKDERKIEDHNQRDGCLYRTREVSNHMFTKKRILADLPTLENENWNTFKTTNCGTIPTPTESLHSPFPPRLSRHMLSLALALVTMDGRAGHTGALQIPLKLVAPQRWTFPALWLHQEMLMIVQ